MTIENAQKDIIDNFLFFDDWTQKYEYIIELSKDLEFMSENLKNKDNLIKGCQSKVWLHACLLYTSPSPRDLWISRMPSSA